ncbi:MAG: HDIG domain-containing protein [Opitutales bacterium]|nr:HDIG domain-containing protein [Opitutales bacterium]
MNYQIFDTNAILLGLLSAMLAAECIILFVKSQSLRRKMDSLIENVSEDANSKLQERKTELEAALKERAQNLENEYRTLLEDARKNNAELEEKMQKLSYGVEKTRLAEHQAADEAAAYVKMRENCRRLEKEYSDKLAGLANLDIEKLYEEAKREIGRKCEEDLAFYRAEIFKKSGKDLETEARRILLDAISRSALSVNAETNACIVKLPNEAMKGRLIGKEGRNIRSFEAVSGTTLVIDETPDSVMISCFDPARRQTAKIALEKLVADGRINPVSIEAAFEDAKQSVEKSSAESGAEAAERLNIKGLHPEILSKLGMLRFHLSLNQNTLEHSMEAALIAGLIASEIGCDVSIARRAALLHDIGKATDGELSHAREGASFLHRLGEDDIVVRAVEAHHNEISDGGIYGAIVQIADSISSTRIGARMTPVDSYFERMKSLEEVATSFDGVMGAYALQAGRELRVIVEPEKIDDVAAAKLAVRLREALSQKIDHSVPVKITLIRERRFVETLQ